MMPRVSIEVPRELAVSWWRVLTGHGIHVPLVTRQEDGEIPDYSADYLLTEGKVRDNGAEVEISTTGDVPLPEATDFGKHFVVIYFGGKKKEPRRRNTKLAVRIIRILSEHGADAKIDLTKLEELIANQ